MSDEELEEVSVALEEGRAAVGANTDSYDGAREQAIEQLPDEIEPEDVIDYRIDLEDGYVSILAYEEEDLERSSPGASLEGGEAYGDTDASRPTF